MKIQAFKQPKVLLILKVTIQNICGCMQYLLSFLKTTIENVYFNPYKSFLLCFKVINKRSA